MVDPIENRLATIEDVTVASSEGAAISSTVNLYMSFAIIGALDEARVLDPMAVVKWAEFFADAQTAVSPPQCRDEVRSALMGFAALLRSMASKPEGSAGTRQ